ncbi:MAG TPA: hypothetical protein VN778_04395, partial [Verrucomicrobiae bacterium]|nr:hypothetical protein [Verrucomicrobiae bacterium]
MPETRPEQSEISKRHIPIIGELTVRAARHIKQFDSLELLDPEWVNLGHHIKGKPLPYKEMSEKAEEA